jgi:hypothetical protein
MKRSIRRVSTLTPKSECSGQWMSRTRFATIVEKKVTSVQIVPSRIKEIRITRASIAMIQAMMEWWKERTRHSSPLQEQCWMIMAHPRSFGRKQSTRRVMHPTECILTDSSRKLHMSSSPEGNQIYHTFESLVANASSIRRKGSVSLRVDVMKVFFLVMHQTPKHIEYSIKPPG